MKKRIVIVIIIFIIIFIFLGRFSFSAINNFIYWQVEKNLKSNINYLKMVSQPDNDIDSNYEKLVASGVFDNIYLVKNEEFIGKIDITLKKNLKQIKNKQKIIIANKIFYFDKINDNQLVFVKQISERYLSDIFLKNLIIYYTIIFLFSIIFIYITYLLIIKPINKLKENTKDIANGNFNLDIDIEGSKEVNELVDNFKKMKNRILRDIELLEFVINNMKLGFILFTKKGKILLINDEAKNVLKINNPDDINIFNLFTFLNISAQNKSKLYSACKISTKDGNPFFADVVYSTFKWKKNYENVIIFRKINNIIKNQNKKLKSSIEYISYTLAHEIKNPLNVISMILQTLKQKYKKEHEQEMWKDIEEEINKINYIINNLLDIIEYDNQYFNLYEFLYEIMKKWGKLYKNKNINFKFNLKDRVELFFDKDKLNIIISNILKNCYENLTKDDKIIFEEYIEKDNVVLEIKDFGKGLNKNQMLKILEKGYTNRKKGTGWGLFIVKFLMQLHGADFEIESKKNNYTKVRLIFKNYENLNS